MTKNRQKLILLSKWFLCGRQNLYNELQTLIDSGLYVNQVIDYGDRWLVIAEIQDDQIQEHEE